MQPSRGVLGRLSPRSQCRSASPPSPAQSPLAPSAFLILELAGRARAAQGSWLAGDARDVALCVAPQALSARFARLQGLHLGFASKTRFIDCLLAGALAASGYRMLCVHRSVVVSSTVALLVANGFRAWCLRVKSIADECDSDSTCPGCLHCHCTSLLTFFILWPLALVTKPRRTINCRDRSARSTARSYAKK